jgi:hypothetical protein
MRKAEVLVELFMLSLYNLVPSKRRETCGTHASSVSVTGILGHVRLSDKRGI